MALVVGIVGVCAAGAPGQERRRASTGARAAAPDYDRVFAMDRVHELRIRIPAAQFVEMQDDLARFGRGRGRGFAPGELPPPSFAGPRGFPFADRDPIAVKVSVQASGRT